jgi:predicted helicase
MMRERFDRIEIIDLRGDLRRGGRAGVEGDQGVFNIQVGTAITVAVADGSKPEGELADVFYHDSWTEGVFARQAKFDWLMSSAEAGTLPNPVPVERGLLDDMRPMPFLNGDLIGLTENFCFYGSGLQTKRDSFVYDPRRTALADRIQSFLTADDDRARQMFHDTRDRKWSGAKAIAFNDSNIDYVAYRPLDRRYLYNHRAYGDFLRTDLQEIWGDDNVCLYALPNGTGAGPAVWCHALLPDYHAFRGSYGGYAFPLYYRRPRVNGSNLSPAIIESLGTAYGEPVRPEDVFDAILCLLSASSYTRRFAEDLEDVFPHVPFPARHVVFEDAVRIGREIRMIETLAREPCEAYRPPVFARVVTQPHVAVAAVEFTDGEITLCADGTGRITGIPEAVWSFAVSGYRVVPRWIEARIGLPADLNLVRELRDICSRIAELIDRFSEADIVLEATLRETLPREALAFDSGGQDEDGG